MPKVSERQKRRSSRRQYVKVDNSKEKSETSRKQKSTKSSTGNERHNALQGKSSKRKRKELRLDKHNIAMKSTELLHSISGGIIESGIKYIMFPLHLLRFCIFGTKKVSKQLAICKNDKKSKHSESSVKKTNKEEESRSSKSKGDRNSKNDEASKRRSSEESRKSTRSGSSTDAKNAGSFRGKDSKELRKVDDKGFAGKPLCTACNTITENVLMDISVEPMDISMEEYTYEGSQIVTESRDQKQNSTLSVDAEIAKIFQKQCTSSEDEYWSFHSWTSSEKRKKTGVKNFLFHARTCQFSPGHQDSAATVPSKSKEEKVVEEWKKKTSSEDVAHNKTRKVPQVENKPEKQKDENSDAKRREEKHSSKQDSPSKSKTQSPITPEKSNEPKRKDVQYKETATQTDSAFSDDDVEMTAVNVKLPETRLCCKRVTYRSHPNLHLSWRAEHDSNYVADNEDLNDGLASIARKRVSSCSTSSSSTDLGFDEHGTPPNSDVGTGRYHTNVHDTISTYRMCSRAPPGFPELPQNPPLLAYTHTGWYKVARTSLRTAVPRAPTPMRHLYYNYPEFMDLPTTANSLQIFNKNF